VILLDTNVISETIRRPRNANVIAWLDAQPANELFIPSLALAEVQYGIALMPMGMRRTMLAEDAAVLVDQLFRGRVVPFGERAAGAYGEIMATRRALGRPLGQMDGLIAATAAASGAVLATRNVRDFEGLGIELINPFDYAP